jgi:DNA-binding response OmpR family regulator
MGIKILVADDSATIQKVIAITLANTSYELAEALSEDDLFKKISMQSYELILLDFSLSQKANPYDLIKQVHEKSPKSKIISLVGTFDSAEDNLIKKAGAADKLTKPFESSKFAKKISTVLEEVGSSEDFELRTPVATTAQDKQDWVLNAPKVSDLTSEKFKQEEIKSENHILKNELDSWGMIPPVIAKMASSQNVIAENQEDLWKVDVPISHQVPSGHDLDYPSVTPPKSKLVPLSELKELEIEEIPAKTVSRSIEINLEEELGDELQTKEEFWATEERAIISDPAIKDMAAGFSQMNSSPSFDRSDEKLDEQKIVSQVVEKITPILERLIKEYCIKSVDKVAWEVIPDLAENLITREIKELSRKAQQG